MNKRTPVNAGKDHFGKPVEIGDHVGFKIDYEGSGKILEILEVETDFSNHFEFMIDQGSSAYDAHRCAEFDPEWGSYTLRTTRVWKTGS